MTCRHIDGIDLIEVLVIERLREMLVLVQQESG